LPPRIAFGITLTGFRKSYDPLGDERDYPIVAVSQSKGGAWHLERNTHDSDGLRIEPVAVEIRPDRYVSELCRNLGDDV
jgi:hypothetical protein